MTQPATSAGLTTTRVPILTGDRSGWLGGRIEFPTAVAERIIAEHEGTTVDHAVSLWTRDD